MSKRLEQSGGHKEGSGVSSAPSAAPDVGSEHRKYEPTVSLEERRHAPDAAEGLRARSAKTNVSLCSTK